MRRVSKILMILGGVLFFLSIVLSFFLSWLDLPYNETRWQYEMIAGAFLKYGTFILIILGLILRLFSPSAEIQENKIPSETNTIVYKDFDFWRRANIFGFCVWLFTSLFMVFLFDSGPSFTAYVIVGLQQLALPLAAVFFYMGIKKEKIDPKKAVFYLKIPFYYGFLAIIIICILIFSGNDIGGTKDTPRGQLLNTTANSVPETTSIVPTDTEFSHPKPASDSQLNSSSNSPIIKITSPNGGEKLKIGDKIRITWEANSPAGVWLDLELFEISEDKTVVGADGRCVNCIGGGLRSGIRALSPITNGPGSVEWSVGKLYSGGYVEPGDHYILKANISKTGSPSECPAQFPTCTVDLGIDWSDAAFSLTY